VWEVPLTEKHLSVAALAFYWLDADSTERVISQILWLDVGDDANIVFVTVSYDDRTATVTVKGDADTAELYAEESDDGDPAGTWYAVDTPTPSFTGNRFATERRGTFSVQTRTDRERFFRVQGKNPDGRFGPYEFFQVDRFQDVVLGEPDVTLISAEVFFFGVGTANDFDNRQVLLNVEVSEDVESIKVLWGPAASIDPSPISGDNTFDITPGTRRILSWYVGAEPTDPDNAAQFPTSYLDDTIVQIQGFSDAGGTTGFLQEARYRFGPNTGLPAFRAVQSTTEIQSDALLVGSGLALSSGTGGRAQVAIDASTLPTVPVASGGTGRDTLTAESVLVGDGINQVKLVTATTNGKVLGVQSNQWAEIDAGGTITGVTAGNGLGGGGFSGSVTLDVNPYVGFTAGYGQTEIVSDSVAVVLGTTGNTAMAGNTPIPQGTVTSVSGTGNVSGITLSGTVTSSGNLTLGGTLSVNLGTSVTGTLAIANGGTGATTATQARTNLGAGTVTSVASGTGLTGGPITGSGTLSLAGQALNLFNQTTTGFFVRTGAGSIVARSIAVTGSNAITISNGDGSAGNPTLQMSTPGTLTKTSTNSNTTAHTHALDGSIADVTVTGSAPTGSPSRAGSLHFVV
jgi:hypothetical protein